MLFELIENKNNKYNSRRLLMPQILYSINVIWLLIDNIFLLVVRYKILEYSSIFNKPSNFGINGVFTTEVFLKLKRFMLD